MRVEKEELENTIQEALDAGEQAEKEVKMLEKEMKEFSQDRDSKLKKIEAR